MGKLLPAMHSAGPVLPARLAKSWEITQWAGKVDVYTCGSLSSSHQEASFWLKMMSEEVP